MTSIASTYATHQPRANIAELPDDMLRTMFNMCSGDLLTQNRIKRTCKEMDVLHVTNLLDVDPAFIEQYTDENLQRYDGKSVTKLSLVDNTVVTATGVEHMLNVAELDVSWNSTATDETVASMTKLTRLRALGNDNITDNTLLRNPNLGILNIAWNTKITTDVVNNLPNLHTLVATKTKLAKITNPSLKRVFLNFNANISDDYISSLSGIEELHLINCSHITNEAFLNMTRLRILNIRDNTTVTTDILVFPNLHTLTDVHIGPGNHETFKNKDLVVRDGLEIHTYVSS